MKAVNFAVVGYGRIGKRHAEILSKLPGAHLAAICDVINPKELPPNAAFYNSLEALLQNEKNLDVLCVCTPNGLHAQQAKKILENGLHVVIEKPMGLNKSNCEEVIHQALVANKQVFCVMQNRYSPPSKWLKDIVDKHLLGQIYQVHINCFWNRGEEYYSPQSWKGTKALDGGVLFTQFSHFVDIMYWLFGDIKNINARFQNFKHQDSTEFEDSGLIHFDFVKGGLGSFNFSTATYKSNLESSITILGEKGSVKVGGQYMNEVLVCNIEDYEMPELEETNPPNIYKGYSGSAANHHFVFQNVLDTLAGKEKVSTNALEGLKVVEIIERMYNSAIEK